MSKIDVSRWGEFKVGDLFEPVLTDGDNKQGNLPEGNIPLVSATADNNGIVGYYDSDTRIFPANSITVDMFGHVFAQSKSFQTVAHGRVNVLLVKDLSVNTSMFVASVIEQAASLYDFGFKSMLNQHKLANLNIKLPITSTGQPDWQYMDAYIAKLATRAHRDVSLLNDVKPKLHKIDIDNWKEFKVGDLFERVSLSFHGNGARRNYISEVQDDIHQLPLLGAKKGNNGIVYYGDPTVFDSIGKCIGIVQNGAASAGLVYPEYDLFGVYTDAYAIKLKNGSELTNESILFVSAVLQKLLFSKYSYDNKCTWSKVKNDMIKLPVTMSGQPDFEYMERYIELLRNNAQKRLCDY